MLGGFQTRLNPLLVISVTRNPTGAEGAEHRIEMGCHLPVLPAVGITDTHNIQWNLQIVDTLGLLQLSFILEVSLLWRLA